MAEHGVTSPSSASSCDPMLLCCRCEKLLDDPQQLRCLHNCCRSCVQQSTAPEAADGCSSTPIATCPICCEMSKTSSNGFLDSRVRRHKAIASASQCGMCAAAASAAAADGGAPAQPADVWCTTCLMSFCTTCTLWHGRFYRAHATVQLQSVDNWDLVSPSPAPSCASHHKAFHVACFTCRASKCPDCWAPCGEQRHDVKPLGSPDVASHVEKVRAIVADLEQTLLQKAQVLTRRIDIDEDLAVALEADLETLKRRKLRLVAEIDSASVVVEQRLRDAYDGLRAKAAVMSNTGTTTERKVRQATDYGRYVVQADVTSELLNQEGALLARMSSLSDELDKLKRPLAVRQCVAFESTLPDDDDQMAELAASWIGTPLVMTDDLCSRSQVQKLPTEASKKAASLHAMPFITVQMPFEFSAVSATEDGRLLLAAGEAGLLEYSLKSGGQLSCWRAPKTQNGQSDAVLSVEALRDGRVAVGTTRERLVVLLRRTGGTRDRETTWLVDSQIRSLPGPPSSLSSHDDVLVIATNVGSGGQLNFAGLNSGWHAGSLRCDYIVASVALTNLQIVTASSGAVTLGDGRKAHVVDAHMRTSDQRLWRCELGDRFCSTLWNICVNATGLKLNVTVCGSHSQPDSGGLRLITISAADGSVLRRDAIDVNVIPPLDKLLATRSGQQIVLVASCVSALKALKKVDVSSKDLKMAKVNA